MELEQIEMASLIPQRPPFMMVDKILSCDDTDAVTELMVRQDNILLGEIKNLKIYRQPLQDERLTTEVHILMDVFDMTLASVCTKVGEEVIAEGRMKLASTNIEAEG